MSAKAIRIRKEARDLFWPWCAVSIAGLLPLLQHRSYSGLSFPEIPRWAVEDISFVGFFFGIPLLAALAFGNEFQYRTISLLLSQPVSRMEIWAEKLSVMTVAVAAAAVAFGIGWRAALQQDPVLWAYFAAWIIAILASTAFWTLLSRSLLGGLALNAGIHSLVPIAWINLPYWFPASQRLSPAQMTIARWTCAFAFLGYICVMLWLGRRKLARFQATGGLAGDDLLTAGPDVMPRAFAGWLRCRSTEPGLNLIRKELRLLRPVWLLSLLVVPAWIGLSAYEYRLASSLAADVTRGLMIVAFIPLMAVLAGSLSLGEERTSGTHLWHMTLPVPARRQWLIKLFTALFAGVVCPALLPILVMFAGGSIFRWPAPFGHWAAAMAWLLAMALLCFASFWCASAVNGTVRAALWVFPVILALALAASSGEWVVRELMDSVFSKFDLFTDFGFTTAVSHLDSSLAGMPPLLFVSLLLLPVLAFAAVQSRRLFSKQLQDSPLFVVRRLLPLALTAFLCSFSFAAFYSFLQHADEQMSSLFLETHQAIENFPPGIAALDSGHPVQLTLDDLAQDSHLSSRTRRWLRGSRITLAPDKPHPGAYCCGGNSRGITFAPQKSYSWYLATIELPSGSACALSFRAGRGFGILGGACK